MYNVWPKIRKSTILLSTKNYFWVFFEIRSENGFLATKIEKKNYIKKKVFSKTNAQRRSLLSATARAASQLLKEYNLRARVLAHVQRRFIVFVNSGQTK